MISEVRCDPPLITDKYLFYNCPDGYTYGSACQLQCMGSFPLIGNDTITCERNDSFTPPRGYWNMGEFQPYCLSTILQIFFWFSTKVLYFIWYWLKTHTFDNLQKTRVISCRHQRTELWHATPGCLACSAKCSVPTNMTFHLEQWARMGPRSPVCLPVQNQKGNIVHLIRYLGVHVSIFLKTSYM